MHERIHRVLDGELSRGDLTADELAVLTDYEAMIAAAATRPVHRVPDLTARVMAHIAELERFAAEAETRAQRSTRRPAVASAVARAMEWLLTPRPLAVRPAWGLAGAAAVGALVFLASANDVELAPPVAVAEPAAAPAEIYVHFRLDAPEASSVHLAGDFTGWEPTYEMHQAQPGVWTVVVPLQAGVHDYAFVIDGEQWTPDPLATTVDDGFGGQNSRLSLLPPERIRA